MMTKFILGSIIFLFQGLLQASETPKWNFYGETNYSKQQTQSLITTLNAEYTFYFYKHLNYSLYIGGKVSTDVDHFGNEIKTNVFTVMGVDF